MSAERWIDIEFSDNCKHDIFAISRETKATTTFALHDIYSLFSGTCCMHNFYYTLKPRILQTMSYI